MLLSSYFYRWLLFNQFFYWSIYCHIPQCSDGILLGENKMTKMKIKLLVGMVASLFAVSANAALISVSGDASTLGSNASIIAAPGDVRDDAAYNTAQQGFDEIQNYTLTSDLMVDGGMIASGTTIDSQMIFLNTGPRNLGTLAEQFNVQWVFSGDILGVMSDRGGLLEFDSNNFLGAAGTIYPNLAFGYRGLETKVGSCNMNLNDCYNFSGDTLNLSMRVTEPGDWIRVITAIPEPATVLMLGLGLVGLGAMARKKNFVKS